MNVGALSEIVERYDLAETIKKNKGVIDLGQLGFGKLLGQGKIGTPFVIKVKKYSQSALKKVEAAGGQILNVE